MILSVSRRTDIPNYYAEWFINRVKEGFLYVRNPMNAHQISRIPIDPEIVDCIVFWTKNPVGIMKHLNELAAYNYYFQFTLTGYGRDIERNIPDKKEIMIPRFKELSEKIGKKRVIWRYDPIIVTDKYTAEYHIRAFEAIAGSLQGYTEKCVISFVDLYRKNMSFVKDNTHGELTEQEMIYIASKLKEIADRYGMTLATCSEKIDLSFLGIEHNSCIDKAVIESIIGAGLDVKKDKNQRAECGCVESVEVGCYNTCLNGCAYCYATYDGDSVNANFAQHDPKSPLLCGTVNEGDKITDRKVRRLRVDQLSFETLL